MGWMVNASPSLSRNPVPILQEAGWVLGPIRGSAECSIFILNGKVNQNRLVSKINVLYSILRKAVNLSETNLNYPCRLFKFCGS